jgi:hypothetical protein
LRAATLLSCIVAALQAQALESAVKRFSKLEDAAHEVQLASDVHAVSALNSDAGVSFKQHFLLNA